MNAEIISVGTELLMGQILNTNTRYLSGRMADFGINMYYHVTVGDNPARLKQCIANAFSRSDIVLFTGGLGPTEDDLTKETVADYFGLELVVNEKYKAWLLEKMSSRGYPCTPNNIKQVMFPADHCIILPNPRGTAPGCIMEKNGKTAILMPGPPWEMEPMFEEEVVPYLQKRSNCMFHSRTIRIFGKGESQVEYAIKDIVDAQSNPTIAPYAKAAETTLRITARCGSEEEGEKLIQPVMQAIEDRVDEFIYSTHGREMHEVCAELRTLGHGARDDRGGCGAEHGLEDKECRLRDVRGHGRTEREGVGYESGEGVGTEHYAEAEEPEEQRAETEVEQVLHEDVGRVLRTGESGLDRCESHLHHEYQDCREQYPYGVDTRYEVVEACHYVKIVLHILTLFLT